MNTNVKNIFNKIDCSKFTFYKTINEKSGVLFLFGAFLALIAGAVLSCAFVDPAPENAGTGFLMFFTFPFLVYFAISLPLMYFFDKKYHDTVQDIFAQIKTLFPEFYIVTKKNEVKKIFDYDVNDFKLDETGKNIIKVYFSSEYFNNNQTYIVSSEIFVSENDANAYNNMLISKMNNIIEDMLDIEDGFKTINKDLFFRYLRTTSPIQSNSAYKSNCEEPLLHDEKAFASFFEWYIKNISETRTCFEENILIANKINEYFSYKNNYILS